MLLSPGLVTRPGSTSTCDPKESHPMLRLTASGYLPIAGLRNC